MQAMTSSDGWATYARIIVESTALIFAFALSTALVLFSVAKERLIGNCTYSILQLRKALLYAFCCIITTRCLAHYTMQLPQEAHAVICSSARLSG